MMNLFGWCVFSLSTFGVAIALFLSGGAWSLVGFAWCVMLFVSGIAFPRVWKKYWLTNRKILKYFDCF